LYPSLDPEKTILQAWSTALQTLEGHSDLVISVAFSPDGKQVVSRSGDTTVRPWNAVTGAAVRTLNGHSDWLTLVAFSSDGKQVVSGSIAAYGLRALSWVYKNIIIIIREVYK
jgi:WD40 repeat protein